MTDSIQDRIAALEQQLAAQPKSPMFTRLAGYYLEVGRAKDALRVCDAGLALYPFYTTAHLIKGKALVALQMKAEARHEFEVVHEMLPWNEAVEHLLSGLEPASAEAAAASAVTTVEESTDTHETVKVVKPPPKTEPVEAAAEELVAEEPTTVQETPAAESEPAAEMVAEEPAAVEPEAAPEEAVAEEMPAVEEEQFAQEDAFGEIVEAEPQAETMQEEQVAEETQEQSTEMVEEPMAEEMTEEAVAPEETVEEVPTEDPFGLAAEESQAEAPAEETPVEEAQPEEEAASATEDTFAANFGELQTETEEPPQEATEEPSMVAEQSDDPFGLAQETAEAPAEESVQGFEAGESFEQFSERMQAELAGTENTLSLEEYLSSGNSEQPDNPGEQGNPGNSIEDITEKLQTAKKITPVINLSSKTPVTPNQADAPAGSSFVTPTLAEIYAKQGWFDDAIKAYKTLAANKPAEKDRFEKRIKELEEQKKQQSG